MTAPANEAPVARAVRLLVAAATDAYWDHSDVERHDEYLAAAADLRDLGTSLPVYLFGIPTAECGCPWCAGTMSRPTESRAG